MSSLPAPSWLPLCSALVPFSLPGSLLRAPPISSHPWCRGPRALCGPAPPARAPATLRRPHVLLLHTLWSVSGGSCVLSACPLLSSGLLLPLTCLPPLLRCLWLDGPSPASFPVAPFTPLALRLSAPLGPLLLSRRSPPLLSRTAVLSNLLACPWPGSSLTLLLDSAGFSDPRRSALHSRSVGFPVRPCYALPVFSFSLLFCFSGGIIFFPVS